jgi:hypothetical protein
MYSPVLLLRVLRDLYIFAWEDGKYQLMKIVWKVVETVDIL